MKRSKMTEEAIARRARQIWEAEGRPEGKALTHWVQAESELSRKLKAKQIRQNFQPLPKASEAA